MIEAREEFLGEVLGVFGSMAEAADVKVDGIPIGVADVVAGGVGFRGFGDAGLADSEPIRVLERHGLVERFEGVIRLGHWKIERETEGGDKCKGRKTGERTWANGGSNQYSVKEQGGVEL